MSAATMPFPEFIKNTWTSTHAVRSVQEPAYQVGPQPCPFLPLSLSRLLDLLDENGEDDYGQIGPTQVAFKTAFQLVCGAIKILGKDVPSSPVVDSEGGIRISWRSSEDRQVKLVCPATRDAPLYIYQASAGGNAVRNQNVTPGVLAERLSWLIDREPAIPKPATD